MTCPKSYADWCAFSSQLLLLILGSVVFCPRCKALYRLPWHLSLTSAVPQTRQEWPRFKAWPLWVDLFWEGLPSAARLLQKWMQGVRISAFLCLRDKLHLVKTSLCWNWTGNLVLRDCWLAEPPKKLCVSFEVVEKLTIAQSSPSEEMLFSQWYSISYGL